MKNTKPIVVISAVNFSDSGPLSILKDATTAFIKYFSADYHLVLLVNSRLLIQQFADADIEMLEYTYPKKSWLLRVWFEYVHCWFISKKMQPFFWLALHDMTPNVSCTGKAVYCHNPAPFYKLSMKEAMMEKSLVFFNLFYGMFYRINIKSNKFIIVQQQWLRDEFIKRYKVKHVVVAYPDVQLPVVIDKPGIPNKKFQFFYPAFPRVFKNYEVLFDAAALLQKKNIDFEVVVTIDGNENAYTKYLFKKYGMLSCVKFIGLQKRDAVLQQYNESDALVFPSKLETWGLPITEIKLYNKTILVANCRYAYETVGNYGKACFFDPNDPLHLSGLMEKAINYSLVFDTPASTAPQQPFTKNWKELFSLILS